MSTAAPARRRGVDHVEVGVEGDGRGGCSRSRSWSRVCDLSRGGVTHDQGVREVEAAPWPGAMATSPGPCSRGRGSSFPRVAPFRSASLLRGHPVCEDAEESVATGILEQDVVGVASH